MNSLEIQKYGGTSMADAAALIQSASVVVRNIEPGKAILVINSAMSDVTSQVQKTMRAAVREGITEEEFQRRKMTKGGLTSQSTEANYWEVFRAIEERRHNLIDGVVETKEASRLHQMVKNRTSEAKNYLHSMVNLKFMHPGYFDWISANMGEGSDAPIFHAHLQAAGVNAVYYDAADTIVTDGKFGDANPLIGSIRDKIKSNLFSDLKKGKVVVIGGYYGANRNGDIMTFSRGGSDLTATVMGHALVPFFDSIGVYLYKADVAGVMSADPKIVQNPHIIPHMLYEEAAALTAMGGKVIHPRAVNHAVRSGRSGRMPFPIFVKSTAEPDLPGTFIDNRELPEDDPIKAISLIKNAVRLTVKGWGMDKPGIMNNITRTLAQIGIDIDFISQPHSKLALDLAFQFEGKEAELEETIRGVLSEGIKANDIDSVDAKRVGVIGVIGKGLSDPLTLRRIIDGMDGEFPELKKPNAYKLTTGEYEASILADLPEGKSQALVRSLHDSLFVYKS